MSILEAFEHIRQIVDSNTGNIIYNLIEDDDLGTNFESIPASPSDEASVENDVELDLSQLEVHDFRHWSPRFPEPHSPLCQNALGHPLLADPP